jgi:hypothetical protein
MSAFAGTNVCSFVSANISRVTRTHFNENGYAKPRRFVRDEALETEAYPRDTANVEERVAAEVAGLQQLSPCV